MPYLLHFSLSSQARLARPWYLIEYNGIRFKLVQQNEWRWADLLLTIVPTASESDRQNAFQAAQEFVNLLSWQLHAPMQLVYSGFRSCLPETRIAEVNPSILTYPRVLFNGNFVNNSPSFVPALDTEHQKLALGLFREALASNNDYFSFLFFWHVLESGRECGDIVAERIIRDHPIYGLDGDVAELSLGCHTLSYHLKENVRNAIAHIRRKSNRRPITLSSLKERYEIAASSRIVRKIAEKYIKHELHIGSRRLYLMRKGRSGFPKYIDPSLEVNPWKWKMAYPTE